MAASPEHVLGPRTCWPASESRPTGTGAFPHELSGGQRQRVVIAMAVANQPKMLVADEPTTGLDVVTQQEILDLLDDLRGDLGLELLIISHDLPLIADRSDDLAIMYAGQIVEAGGTDRILSTPDHPYTRALLAAFPSLDGPPRSVAAIKGEAPDPANLPNGCAFAARCEIAIVLCTTTAPDLEKAGDHWVACHLAVRRPATAGTS